MGNITTESETLSQTTIKLTKRVKPRSGVQSERVRTWSSETESQTTIRSTVRESRKMGFEGRDADQAQESSTERTEKRRGRGAG